MTKQTRYTMEVCKTTNAKDQTFYFKVVCGVCRRINKAEYQKLEDNADGLDCLYTTRSRGMVRQFKTLSFYTDLVF